MKNKLLLTSALVSAVSVTGIAQAEIKWGLNHEQTFAAVGAKTGDIGGHVIGSETNLNASGSLGLSNGLKVGFQLNWEMDGSDAREYEMSVGNDSFAVIFGNDFTQDIISTAVPKVGEHPGTIAARGAVVAYNDSFNVVEVGQYDHVSLMAKNVAGGNIVYTYAPNLSSTNDDGQLNSTITTGGSGWGLSYVGKPVENLSVAIAQGRRTPNNASAANARDDKETLYSVGYAMGKLAVGAEQRKAEFTGGTVEKKGTYYGATYNMSDNASIGLFKLSTEQKNSSNPDESQKGATIGYNFGGLGLEFSYAKVENANNSATVTDYDVFQLRTKVAF